MDFRRTYILWIKYTLYKIYISPFYEIIRERNYFGFHLLYRREKNTILCKNLLTRIKCLKIAHFVKNPEFYQKRAILSKNLDFDKKI